MPDLKDGRDYEDALLTEAAGDIPVAEGNFSKEVEDRTGEGDKILRKMLSTPPNPRK